MTLCYINVQLTLTLTLPLIFFLHRFLHRNSPKSSHPPWCSPPSFPHTATLSCSIIIQHSTQMESSLPCQHVGFKSHTHAYTVTHMQSSICSAGLFLHGTVRGYWHQRADERLGDPPPRWIQEPLVVRNRDGRPPRGPSGSALLLNIRLRNDLYCVEWDVKLYYTILCFCVCSGSALLGDLLGISRSRERDLLFVL